MNYTESLSRKMTSDLHEGEEGYEIDPITVMIVSTALIEIIKLLYECQKDKDETIDIVTEPTKWHIRILKAVLRRQLGIIEYFFSGKQYIKIFKNTGQKMNYGNIKQLFKENIDAYGTGND